MAVDLRVISLGAGVQSTALYLLADAGAFDVKPDLAIFADTQQEPPWVYENLERLEARGDIPIRRVSTGGLGEAIRTGINSTGQRFASVPFWVRNDDGSRGMGRRHCTQEYKLRAIHGAIRAQLGLVPKERTRKRAEEWLGISTDEAHRAKPSRVSWITTRWPLLFDRPMSRGACLLYLDSIGYPRPGKSACVFCPFRSPTEWARWKVEEPALFERACEWDEAIRSTGTMRGMRGQQFISWQLKPLREVTADAEQDDQLDLFGNECEGMCGV